MDEQTTELTTAAPEEKPQDLNDIFKVGFLVGVKQDGSFDFNVFGKEQGIVELMGLCNFATNQVNLLADNSLKQGLPLLANMLASISREVNELKKKMEDQSAPNNKL